MSFSEKFALKLIVSLIISILDYEYKHYRLSSQQFSKFKSHLWRKANSLQWPVVLGS